MKTFTDLRQIDESLSNQDPPTILVLRRTAIRIFPQGQRVATYRNDNLDLEVAIPYNPNTLGKHKISSISQSSEVTEEVEPSKKKLLKDIKKPADIPDQGEGMQEAVLHHLHTVTKTKSPVDVKFKNGSSARVTPQVAAQIMRLHTLLSPQNKTKIEALVNTSPDGLQKVAEFAAAHLK